MRWCGSNAFAHLVRLVRVWDGTHLHNLSNVTDPHLLPAGDVDACSLGYRTGLFDAQAA